jgi:cell division protein FtsB
MFILRKKYKKIKEENITLIKQIEDLEKQLSIEKGKVAFWQFKAIGGNAKISNIAHLC